MFKIGFTTFSSTHRKIRLHFKFFEIARCRLQIETLLIFRVDFILNNVFKIACLTQLACWTNAKFRSVRTATKIGLDLEKFLIFAWSIHTEFFWFCMGSSLLRWGRVDDQKVKPFTWRPYLPIWDPDIFQKYYNKRQKAFVIFFTVFIIHCVSGCSLLGVLNNFE